MLKKLSDLKPEELKGKKVIVRCDFNVPVDNGKVLDDLRIRKTLPTIKFLRDAGAQIILISHIEGNKSNPSGGVDSLEPVVKHITETYPTEFGLEYNAGGTLRPLDFVKDYLTDAGILETKKHLLNIQDGAVTLFENLRIDGGEKKNSEEFAKKIAQYGEIYVNDAFAVSHREHASVVALPKLLPHYAGLQLIKEIENLSKVFNAPRPFIFILGGAKFETKLPLINKFLTDERGADAVFIGGALLNDVLQAKGFSVGASLVSKEPVNLTNVVKNPKLIIPDDVVVQDRQVKSIKDVAKEDSIMDVGPSFTTKLKEGLKLAKFVLWNGPMGNYELGFKDQTLAMAKAIAESGVQAAIGGGDTTAAVAELGLEGNNIFVSTGGGAMLEYLQNETLPGIEALS